MLGATWRATSCENSMASICGDGKKAGVRGVSPSKNMYSAQSKKLQILKSVLQNNGVGPESIRQSQGAK